MVIKGGSRGGAGALAGHLLRADTNERVEVIELHNVAADTLPAALREMAAVATGTRCTRPLYHASLNTGPGETLTSAQQRYAIAALERRLGLTGHPRAVVEHRKAGRDHLHVVWSRIDTATMRAVHDGFNYRAHEEVARQLERKFAHRHVQGAHVGRETPEGDRKLRPARTPATAELQQAERTGTDPAAITAEVTRLWQAADSGKAFAAALHAAGYRLVQGDKRGFCLVDPAGGVHSLARRIEGVRTKEITARLAGIDLASLPTVAQARDQVRQRQAAPKIPPSRLPLSPPAAGQAAALKLSAANAPEKRPGVRVEQRRSDPADKHQPTGGYGRRGSEILYSVGIRPARPARGGTVPPARSRPAGSMLAALGNFLGANRPSCRLSMRAAIPRLLTLFLEPWPLFMPGGGGAASRVTPMKSSPPERLNLRRPDGPSTESIAKLQEQIDKLTAYGLSTGESTADQVQEIKNVLHVLLEKASIQAILGPYYRPENRRQKPGR